MKLRSIVAAAAVALSACTSSSSDVVAASVWGEATVVEELAIGVEFGADEYMFGRVRSVAVATDDTIYVADGQVPIVRMYQDDGTFVRNIGRQGQGPGEYAAAPALGVLPDGILVMRDGLTSRMSFFSAAGEYLDSFPIVSSGSSILVDRDGSIHAEYFDGVVHMLTYSTEGEELGRVTFPPWDMAGAETFALGFGEGGILSFPTETRSAWSPLGYLVTGRNDVYDIELRKPDGTVHLTRDLDPVPVGSEEQAEWEAFRQTLVRRDFGTGETYEFEPIPDVKPFFRRIYAGQDGRIWVFRYVAAEKRADIEPLPDRPERPLLTWREPWTYDVFEPDGTFLGSVVVPELFRPFVFRGDRIWGTLADEEGVERLVRLRVVPRDQ